MRVSDLKPGQRFKLATDARTLTALDCDPAFSNDTVFAVDQSHSLVGCHPDSACELVETPAALPFTISHYSGDGKQCSGRVEISEHGIDVHFDGYGTMDSAPGYGAPLFIEVGDDGHPVAIAWAEIDSDDFTHKVSLAMARER